MKILITGANGFVGQALSSALTSAGYFALGVTRKEIGNIDDKTDWSSVLEGIDVVIHAAARVHMMKESLSDAINQHNLVNNLGAVNLFKQALKAGVRKFIFLSTVNVFINQKNYAINNLFFDINAKPSPDEPYGIAKLNSETTMKKLAKNSQINLTILRLPMVYGFGAKGNFPKLLNLVKKIPFLPFGLFQDKRSFLYIGNLVSAILAIIQNPASHNQTYLLSDNDDVSTAELVKKIAKAYGLKRYLIPVPLFLFKWLGAVTGKQKAISRLLGSLQVESTKICRELNWKPPYTVETGLAEMALLERVMTKRDNHGT